MLIELAVERFMWQLWQQ